MMVEWVRREPCGMKHVLSDIYIYAGHVGIVKEQPRTVPARST